MTNLKFETDASVNWKGYVRNWKDIDNLELATKDMIFIGVNTNNTQGIVNHPLHCEEYADITKKLEFVKSLVDKSADTRIIKDMLDHIIDVVDYLVRSID